MSLTGLERALAIAARWGARAAGLIILASSVLVAAEVAGRNLGLGLQLESFELTRFGYAAAIAFALSFALTERAHIRIDVFTSWLPLPARALLDVVALIALAAMAALMARHAWGVTGTSLRLGAMPPSTLRLPLAIPQAIWAVGLTWFAATAWALSAIALARLLRGRFAEVHATAGPPTEAAEDAR